MRSNPAARCAGVNGTLNAIPAFTAVLKSANHCIPASTGEPGGSATASGVRLIARSGVIGPPRDAVTVAPETSNTVQSSGIAAAMAGAVQEPALSATLG